MIYRIGRATRNVMIGVVLFSALAMTGMRLLLPEIKAYRAELEAKVGEALGAPVKIGSLRAHIAGFRPELILADIQVTAVSGPGPAIQLQEIRLGVDLLDSILSRRFLSAMRVTLVGAKLGIIRKTDGSLAITGLKSGGEPPLWLLQGRNYQVLHSEVVWHNEKDGGRPLIFGDVDIFIANHHDDQRRQIHVWLNLPKTLGRSLRLSMDTTGNIFAPGGVNGRLYAEGKGVNVHELFADNLPGELHAGAADFKFWSDWDQSRMVMLLGDLRMTQGKLLGADNETLDIDTLTALFRWQRGEDYWQLQVKNLHLDAGELQWNGEAFSMRAMTSGADESVQQAAAFIPHLNIADLSRLALFSRQLEASRAQLIKRLNPAGSLQNVAFFVEPAKQRYAFRGEFAQLGWSAMDSIPAVKGVSGSIQGSEQGGAVQLAARNAQIDFPDLFDAALPVSRLSGILQWRQTSEQWQLTGTLLELDTPDIETKNRLLLQIPKGSEPVFIDLQTAFGNVKNVAQAKKYLPSRIMDDDVVAWLNRALVAGKVATGAALLRGNLKDYPYTGHQGVFEVLFATQGLELNVHTDWPNIKGIDAEVQFQQGALQADIRSGESEGLRIKEAAASIASLENSNQVILKGTVSGDVQDGLKYLQKTPLRETVNPLLEFIAARGASDAGLNLQIPLTDTAAVKVDGALHLRNAELTVLPLNIPVQAIKGDLQFNERGISAQGIKGRALGSKIAADILQSGEQTVVRVEGQAAVKNLAAAFPSPYWTALQGLTDYQVRLAFPGIGKQAASLELTSDLQGVALDLPGTLRKTAQQPRSLRAEFSFPDGALVPAVVNYGDELQAAAYIDKQHGKLFSADVLLSQSGSGSQAVLSAQPGLTVGVKRTDFDLDPWFKAMGQGSKADTPASLRAVKIETQHLRWQNHDLGPLALDLMRLNGRWAGTVKSNLAAGNISAPERFSRTEKVVLDMQTLNLSSLTAVQLPGDALSPLEFPALQIKSHRVLWRSVDLGALNLHAAATANGLDFSTVELRAADQSLRLTGRWQASGKQSFCEAKGTFRSDALGKFLVQTDILQDMQDTPAQIDFTLHWPGAPHQASFANVQGVVDARLEEGRMLGINPGIGRLLGILALDQWKRRLQLDFSDAYAEGLTYNRITGRFELSGGYAFTDNLVIEAVPAKIEIKGKTGLATQDWDQLVIVSPKTSAALPIAGTIAGKLITGAASLFVEPSVVEELKHFASAAYAVKGKWGAAEITPLHASDGLLRKVWTGMTDFSWLQ